MSDKKMDEAVENEEVNVDDLEPNADPKGGMGLKVKPLPLENVKPIIHQVAPGITQPTKTKL